MKCDMNLVRTILLEIENQGSGYAPINLAIEGYNQEQIRYHAHIMTQCGLIESINCTDLSSKSPQAIPTSLTWQGHEFIESARNETLWKKAMTTAQEKGTSITIPVISQLLTSLIKNQLGLH